MFQTIIHPTEFDELTREAFRVDPYPERSILPRRTRVGNAPCWSPDWPSWPWAIASRPRRTRRPKTPSAIPTDWPSGG